MPPKPPAKPKARATDDDIDDLFKDIDDEAPVKKPAAKSKAALKAKPDEDDDADILAELEDQLGEAPAISRPQTPRVKEKLAKRPASEKAGSDDKTSTAARKSVDSSRDYHSSFTPSASSSDVHDVDKRDTAPAAAAPAAAGSSWWGGILASATATASAAMKQAEEAARQLQQSEEAKKWATQVQSNVGAIRGFVGEEIRHRALPTFSDILHTLAPPIASHERLSIHVTHDIVGYPSLDPLVYSVFSRVMAQVEGGDLVVIQRGQENTAGRPRSSSQLFASSDPSTYGWRDGPWWRAVDSPRNLRAVRGLPEGTKLCRVSAEAYADEYYSAHGGLELARQRAIQPVSEDNPVRSSDLFLALQAITIKSDEGELFNASTATAASAKGKEESDDDDEESDEDDEKEDTADKEQIVFAVYVLDPVHDISFHAVSQAVPAEWLRWMDAAPPLTPASSGGDDPDGDAAGFLGRIPEEIRDVVESGGVDPREWVAEWLEELLNLSVGVVAQRYVARRMGVGIGGLGKGKRRTETVVQDGGGEAARAGLI
ncbi:hypothetical protein GGTG_02487 [Gaeumannomyces tritici R3-111a-1]|uniref:Maintenance of telomere capping protein 1 n=1 Tax=Gaeumannomyces tritici (strain R3-111a-1) TaxID=644352 RepID=J3NMI1_GAET3|nr:hypothetical protein GGTG_02487 [Gaeumannomyces tritici R3-111a-1]EJT82514.1 hypothetical protein GGTG_02487 [Gaeumannomyces tritici R3-111a-1]